MPGPAARQLARLVAGSAVVILVAGCGLGDLPARSSGSSEGPSSAPSASPVPSASPSGSPGPTAAPTASPQPSAFVYVVKANDSLVNLGHRFKTTGRSIAYWNRKAYPSLDPDKPTYNPNHLEIGWRLTIYPGLIDNDGNGLPDASPTPAPPIAPSIPPAASPPADGSGLLVTRGAPGGNDVALTFNLDTAGLGLGHRQLAGPARGPRHRIRQRPAGWLRPGDRSAPPGARDASRPVHDRQRIERRRRPRFDVGRAGKRRGDERRGRHPGGQRPELEAVFPPSVRHPESGDPGRGRRRPASATRSCGMSTRTTPTPSAQGGPTAQDIVSRVLSRASGGSIVLLHLGGEHTLEALPGILDGLSQAGLAAVSLAEMFGR